MVGWIELEIRGEARWHGRRAAADMAVGTGEIGPSAPVGPVAARHREHTMNKQRTQPKYAPGHAYFEFPFYGRTCPHAAA
jgi:hypothetical protein